MKLTIRKKLLLCAFLPIGILGIIIIVIAATSLRGYLERRIQYFPIGKAFGHHQGKIRYGSHFFLRG